MSQKEQTENKYYVWNVNGHSFELDMQDVENARRYEKAFAIMGEEEAKLPKDGKDSDRILAYCMLFRHLFDNLLGEGAADLIFGKTNNARIMNEVYEDFLSFVANQGAALAETQARMLGRFSPNRAQRRAATRGKNRVN